MEEIVIEKQNSKILDIICEASTYEWAFFLTYLQKHIMYN